ncbi:MAG: electron transfer flavoprotein subunit beta/FixA family protein [Planctomycetes bacterium]|nr:electron transfer flavoprotein subunit beta/FixA family protein [Planctomycetota bacterium]
MRITVCVAVTPSTEARIKIAADGKSLDATEVKYELNPYDDFAVEEALRMRDAAGEGEVEIVLVGTGSQAETEELRKCLAKGADRAVILEGNPNDTDSGGVANALAAYLGTVENRAIFFGKQAVDGDSAQVPSYVAARLGWPVVTKISKLEVSGNDFVAQREIEGAVEIVKGTFPAVFSAEKGLNEPRRPTLKGIMAAKKKPLDKQATSLPAPTLIVTSMELPPARPAGRIVGEGKDAVAALMDALKNEAKVI